MYYMYYMEKCIYVLVYYKYRYIYSLDAKDISKGGSLRI